MDRNVAAGRFVLVHAPPPVFPSCRRSYLEELQALHLATLVCSSVPVSSQELPWQDSQCLCHHIASLPGQKLYHQASIVHRTTLIISGIDTLLLAKRKASAAFLVITACGIGT